MDRTYEKYQDYYDEEYYDEYEYNDRSTQFYSSDDKGFSNVYRTCLDKTHSEYVEVSQS